MKDLIETLIAIACQHGGEELYKSRIEWKAAKEIERLQTRVEARETRLREEIMESYNGLTSTRKARYSGPEEYADAVLQAEQGESDDE